MTDDELNELKQRLLRLEQIERARGYVHTYAETMDVPDPKAASGLFREDGVLTTARGVARGRAEIEDFYRAAFTDDPSEKRHFVCNLHATWLADGLVRVQSYFLFLGRGSEVSLIGWGTYDDTVDVSAEQPCFADKTITMHMKTTLEQGWTRHRASA